MYLVLARTKEVELGVLVSATASTLVPPASGVTEVLLTPRGGSGAATSDAISTGWLFKAAALHRRNYDLAHLPPDPNSPSLPLLGGTRPPVRVPLRALR